MRDAESVASSLEDVIEERGGGEKERDQGL